MMWRLIFLVCFFLESGVSFAATVPVSNMQNAVSGVIQAKVSSRGFSSNDPRFSATLQGAGSAIAGTAAAAALVTAAGVTAPAWVTVGVATGLGVLFSAGINLAIDGIKWLFNSDGSVTFGSSSAGSGMTAGGTYWANVGGNLSVYGGSAEDVAKGFAQRANIAGWAKVRCPGGSYVTCEILREDDWPVESVLVASVSSGAPVTCAGTSNGTDCLALPGSGGQTTSSPSDASQALTPSEKAKPLNPEILAAMANEAYKKAASQPGYAGVPYDPVAPITAAEASAWQSANPDSWPSVGDFVAPQPAPAAGNAASPFVLPGGAAVAVRDPAAAPSPAINPSTEPLANLGPDPVVGMPTLESIPTAQAILSPLLGLFPSYKNFVVPSHPAVCPTPSVTIFQKFISLDGHCALLEDVRPALAAVMAFVWLGIASFIVFRA